MNGNAEHNGYIAYEYKDISVKGDSAAMYKDCYKSFGWTLVEQYEFGAHVSGSDYVPVGVAHVAADMGRAADVGLVTLRFKRDRRLPDKHKLDMLQRECEDALSAIDHLEKKGATQTMGPTLGTGIVGAGFAALAVYNFVAASTLFGVVFAIIGFTVCGAGFLAYSRIGGKKKAHLAPLVQQQLEVVYSACEQAHTMLV